MASPAPIRLPAELIEEYYRLAPTFPGKLATLCTQLSESYALQIKACTIQAKLRNADLPRYKASRKAHLDFLKANGLAPSKPVAGRIQPGQGYTVLMTREQLGARGFIKLDK